MSSTELVLTDSAPYRSLAQQHGEEQKQSLAVSFFGGQMSDDPNEDADDQAVARWLLHVRNRNANTFRSYEAEVYRFRIFLECIHAGDNTRSFFHLLRDATEEDIAYYEAQLTGKYRSNEEVKLLVVHPQVMDRLNRRDQPFANLEDLGGGTSQFVQKVHAQSSANQALSILHSLYSFWLRPNTKTKLAYVGANPVTSTKGARSRKAQQIDRNFSMDAILAMLATIDRQLLLAGEDKTATGMLERRRWILALLFGLWGRRSEIANLKMNDFKHDAAADEWKVSVHRKGGDNDRLPVAPWVMHSLMRYRQHLGLSALPATTDTTAAIRRVRTRVGQEDKPINSVVIYNEVLSVGAAAASLLDAGEILPELDPVKRQQTIQKLKDMSPHWFRHSGASIAINSGALSLENASKLLGHSNPEVTAQMYYHGSDSLIRDGMQQLGGSAFS